MKKVIMLFSLIFLSSFAFADNAKINVSPIVQVVSYKDVYGKYVEMMGRGSASIINTGGIIITNNHVVTDENGNEIKAFSICITKNENSKPSCDYTATLIARNANMDIAMLKINPKDIYGNDVDYSAFKTIDVDFDYVPKTQDEVLTIGYPWIGAETITQTKGIISGIVEYNSYKYIKTDALIEGGNSGGGLINLKTGKLIGVPTYTYGDSTTLSYALSIGQAKEFITKNIDKQVEPKTFKIDFSDYRKTLENINLSGQILDDVFDVKFSDDYETWHYIKDKVIKIKNSKNKNNIISTFGVKVMNVPDISKDSDFFYLLQLMNIYNKSYQDLVKQNIGGVDFYTPVLTSDKTSGDLSPSKIYIGRLNKNTLVIMQIQAYVTKETSTNLNAEITKFLKGITFKKDFTATFDFETFDPAFKVNAGKNLSLTDYDGSIVSFMGDLHEYFAIQISDRDEDTGKGTSVKDLYNMDTQDIKTNYKTMFTLNGQEGYLYCADAGTDFGFSQDENGNQLNQTTCAGKIYTKTDGKDDNYYLEISMKIDKSNRIEKMNEFINFLKNNVNITKNGTRITNIPNVFEQKDTLKFKDLGEQSVDYKKRLALLVKYNLISNTDKLDPYKPLKWSEFLTLYFKMIYNFDVAKTAKGCKTMQCVFENYKVEINGDQISLFQVIKDLGIDINKYIDVNDLQLFTNALDLRLAGINPKEITRQRIYQYINLYDEDIFTEWKQKVSDFINKTYGKEKIEGSDVIGDTKDFVAIKNVYYSPYLGIISKVTYANNQISFGYNLPLTSEFTDCFEKTGTNLQNECLKNFYKSNNALEIVTKYKAIDYIYQFIDFGLFDKELAAKKDIIVKKQSSTDTQAISDNLDSIGTGDAQNDTGDNVNAD